MGLEDASFLRHSASLQQIILWMFLRSDEVGAIVYNDADFDRDKFFQYLGVFDLRSSLAGYAGWQGKVSLL